MIMERLKLMKNFGTIIVLLLVSCTPRKHSENKVKEPSSYFETYIIINDSCIESTKLFKWENQKHIVQYDTLAQPFPNIQIITKNKDTIIKRIFNEYLVDLVNNRFIYLKPNILIPSGIDSMTAYSVSLTKPYSVNNLGFAKDLELVQYDSNYVKNVKPKMPFIVYFLKKLGVKGIPDKLCNYGE